MSARTRRDFTAFLVAQPDGKIGFEFEAKDGAKGKGARAARGGDGAARARRAPEDKRPVELHAGRYGPYVKHGDVNATIPDKDHADAHNARRGASRCSPPNRAAEMAAAAPRKTAASKTAAAVAKAPPKIRREAGPRRTAQAAEDGAQDGHGSSAARGQEDCCQEPRRRRRGQATQGWQVSPVR